jgi:hypothetical protein
MIEIEEKQYLKAKAIFDFITPSACLAFLERGMKRKKYDYDNDYSDDNHNDGDYGDNGDDDSSLVLEGIAGTGTIEGDNVGNSESVEDTVTSSESSSSHNNDCNSYNRNNSKNGNYYNNAHIMNTSNNKSKKKKKKKNNNNSTISSSDNNRSKVGIGLRGEDEGVGGIGIEARGGVGVGAGAGVESLESESLRSLLGFSSFKSSYKNN